MKKDKSAPLSLVGNGRNREKIGVNALKNTLIHMQYGDVSGPNGIKNEGIWEIELANGHYLITVSAGDGSLDGPGTVPSHTINIEGENVIDKLPEIVERKFALKYLKEIGYGLLIASVLI